MKIQSDKYEEDECHDDQSLYWPLASKYHAMVLSDQQASSICRSSLVPIYKNVVIFSFMFSINLDSFMFTLEFWSTSKMLYFSQHGVTLRPTSIEI